MISEEELRIYQARGIMNRTEASSLTAEIRRLREENKRLKVHEPGCQEIWNREIRRADRYRKVLEWIKGRMADIAFDKEVTPAISMRVRNVAVSGGMRHEAPSARRVGDMDKPAADQVLALVKRGGTMKIRVQQLDQTDE